jgi:Fur family transcriptional regulator, ferric uptake regulator
LQQVAIAMSCFVTFKKQGYRITQPRKMILDYIHDRGNNITAEDIISHVHKQLPNVNKSTVYRTLETLEKNRCIYRSEYMNRTIYHHSDDSHHHHLVCRRCGKTIECDDILFENVEKLIAGKYGFRIDLNHLVIDGLCDKCIDI